MNPEKHNMETIVINGMEFLARQSLQIGIVAILAGLACLALRRSSAHIRYLVWVVVLAKCFVPGIVPVPLAILPAGPGASSPYSNGDEATDSQPAPTAWQTTITLGDAPQTSEVLPLWRTITPAGWMAMVWMMGMTFFLGYAGYKAIGLERQLRSNRKPIADHLAGIVEEVAARFRTKCRVFAVPGIGQPFVWGLLRGAIYLPADFERSGDCRNYYKVLAHEFAHVARFDPLVNAVQVLVQAVFFFHPLVWIMNRMLRMEREKCCDETAIALLETSPREYGAGIVQVLMHECRRSSATPTLAAGGSVRTIEERIRAILRPGRRFRARISPVAALGVILFAVMTLPTGILFAQKDHQTPTATPATTTDNESSNPAVSVNTEITPAVTPQDPSQQLTSMQRLVAQLKAQIEELRASQAAMSRRIEELLRGRQPETPVLLMAPNLTGTWWFDNAAGDDEQMAIDNEGRVVVLYSNGHRDSATLRDGTMELAEYGGATAHFRMEDGIIIQELTLAGTDQKALKRWTRIDPQPRYEPLRPLSGDHFPRTVKIGIHLLDVKRGFLEGLALPELTRPIAGSTITLLASEAPLIIHDGLTDSAPSVQKALCTILDESVADRILEAAKGSKDTTMLSSPKVMVLSGQEAIVEVGQYVPASSDNAKNPSTETTSQQIRQGIKLSMTPNETGPDQTIFLSFRVELIGMSLRFNQDTLRADRIQIQSEISIPKGKALLVHGIYTGAKDHSDKSNEFLLLIRPEVMQPEEPAKVDNPKPMTDPTQAIQPVSF
jgi:beta-lactamase regulating signal transducer with metallopeptidase domain